MPVLLWISYTFRLVFQCDHMLCQCFFHYDQSCNDLLAKWLTIAHISFCCMGNHSDYLLLVFQICPSHLIYLLLHRPFEFSLQYHCLNMFSLFLMPLLYLGTHMRK